MSDNKKRLQGMDIPIEKLIPQKERKVKPRHRKRLEASLRALGQLDPLIVCPHGDKYRILDGCQRYCVLLDMGVETVPCLIWNSHARKTTS